MLTELKTMFAKIILYFSYDGKMKRLNNKLGRLEKEEVLADLQNKVDAKQQKIVESRVRGIFK